jgi:beta-lactamase regulating signal transducer with metallopeptidase domain
MEPVWNTVIKAIGWSIFHSLWQGAVLYGILFLLMAGLPKLSARNRHNLAFGGICLLLLAFCVTFVSFLKVPETPAATETAKVTVPLSTANAIPGLPAGMYERAEGLFPYIVAIYALGLLVQVLLIATGFYKLNQLKQAARSPIPTGWQEVFENIVLDLRISKRVGFYLSEYVHVPLVIGYFKPIVLFPVALATQLDLKQVEAILIHELSHIRRNDYLLNLVKTCIETLLFFNPFVWLSSRFIQIEREHACDDLVLDLTGTPKTYAHALLKIELLKVKDTPTLSLAASGNSQHLYQRIKRITDMKTNYMNPKQQIFAVALTVATLVSLAWANPREKKIVQTAVTTTVEQVQESAPRLALPKVVMPKRRMLKVIPVSLPFDTPRKKKSVKIITVDENGKRTEYKSVRELPDSIKAELNEHQFYVQAFPKGFPDTASLLALRKNAEALALKFNNPEERARLQKLGAEMAKRGELFRKKFDTPEQRAKWEKLGIEMRKQGELFRQKMNSPEERAKWKKLQLDMKKHSEEMQKHTKEQQKEMLKLSEDMRLKAKEMQEMMYLPDVAVRVEKLKTEIRAVN